jgi:hypothetical protein
MHYIGTANFCKHKKYIAHSRESFFFYTSSSHLHFCHHSVAALVSYCRLEWRRTVPRRTIHCCWIVDARIHMSTTVGTAAGDLNSKWSPSIVNRYYCSALRTREGEKKQRTERKFEKETSAWENGRRARGGRASKVDGRTQVTTVRSLARRRSRHDAFRLNHTMASVCFFPGLY